MFVNLIFGLILTSLVGSLLVIIPNLIIISWAYLRFKWHSKGYKIVEGFSPLDGSLRSIAFKPFILYDVPKYVQKYGKSFAFMFGSRPIVVTVDLDLIKRNLVDEQASNRVKINAPIKEMEEDSIFLAEGDQWRRLRRAVAPAFKSNKFKTQNVMREIEGSISKFIEAIEVRLDAREAEGNIRVNIDDLAHRYALDLTLSCFYKQDKVIDFYAKEDFMTKTVDEGFEAVMFNPMFRLSIACPTLRPIIDWLILNFHPQGAWRKLIMEFIKRQTKLNLEARKQLEKLRVAGKQVDGDNVLLADGSKFSRNMIDGVIDQFHEGKISKREYFHSTWFLLGAADRTSTDCIVYTICQLGINQEIQEKLRKSIELHGSDSEYLAWVLNESLRLLPPAPLGCTRAVERDIVDSEGRVLPAGSVLLTPAYTIHRLEEYWGPDAEEFKPERFANTSHFHPFQYIPFGAGPRMCPGREFALFEMKKLLCALLIKYKFHCEPTTIRYNAPIFLFILADKHSYVTISRLHAAN